MRDKVICQQLIPNLWSIHHEQRSTLHAGFSPEVKEAADPDLNGQLTKKYLEPDVRNAWYLQGMSNDQLQNIQKFYNERSGGAVMPRLRSHEGLIRLT